MMWTRGMPAARQTACGEARWARVGNLKSVLKLSLTVTVTVGPSRRRYHESGQTVTIAGTPAQVTRVGARRRAMSSGASEYHWQTLRLEHRASGT